MIDNPIYKAQCFGNIEPIEYMVPYPNLRSLAIGQCIKFADNILFEDSGLTNGDFLKSMNKYCNWLANQEITQNDKVILKNIKSPIFDTICYAVWSLGAIVVIINEDIDINQINSKLIIDSNSNLAEVENQSDEYTTTSNVLLNDAALEYYYFGKGIILSHYNLLINTYGIQKELNILHHETLKVDIPQNTTAYIVLNTILPLYAGTLVSNKEAQISFGIDDKADYQIQFDWKNLRDTKPQSLYILPEATAILSIGKKPNHLTSIIEESDSYKINGHSVMMGYTNDKLNSTVFKSDSLIISK